MWPFGASTAHVQQVAALLDAAFSETLRKIAVSGVDAFRAALASDPAVTLVNGGPAAHNTISWRDGRLPNFMFWVDLNADPWSLHAICDNSRPSPSFVGISVNGGPSTSSSSGASKAVSVEDHIRVKATSAAKQLGQVLSSTYGYRDLTKFLRAFGG